MNYSTTRCHRWCSGEYRFCSVPSFIAYEYEALPAVTRRRAWRARRGPTGVEAVWWRGRRRKVARRHRADRGPRHGPCRSLDGGLYRPDDRNRVSRSGPVVDVDKFHDGGSFRRAATARNAGRRVWRAVACVASGDRTARLRSVNVPARCGPRSPRGSPPSAVCARPAPNSARNQHSMAR